MNNNKLIAFILGAIFIGTVSYVLSTGVFKKSVQPSPGKIKTQIVASFYPLYFFANQIGGNKVEVTNITPAGVEPHDYEPSTQDIARIEKANLLVLNGQVEPYEDKIKDDLKGKSVEIVTAADGLVTQEVEEDGEMIKDPHVWLDPIRAKQEMQKIAQALITVDPSNATYYQDNEKSLESKFDALDVEFKNGLANCQQQNIVTSHAAFGYLASRYGLKQSPIAGLSPDQEPSPKQLSDVAKFAKENNVKYIFFETLISPKLSETIANEVGAKTIAFTPLEGLTPDEIQSGKDYFSVQRENLASLRIALECK